MLAPKVPFSKIVPLLELDLKLKLELELKLELKSKLESFCYNKFVLLYVSLGDFIVEV